METVKQNVSYVLAEIVGVTLDIQQERVNRLGVNPRGTRLAYLHKLIALEWTRLVFVLKLDNDSMLLNVSNAKPCVGQRRNERRTSGRSSSSSRSVRQLTLNEITNI